MNNGTRDWRDWDSKFRSTLWKQRSPLSSTSYALEFSKQVLQHVDGLEPSAVTPEFPITDSEFGVIHIDFAIILHGHRIAIELDGYDKKGDGSGVSKAQYDAIHSRQRKLQLAGWDVLTFTNSEFTRDPRLCRKQIEELLSRDPHKDPKAAVANKPRANSTAKAPQPRRTPTTKATREAAKAVEASQPAQKSQSGTVAATIAITAALVGATVWFVTQIPSNDPQFRNPNNPDCPEFSTRAELNSWAAAHPDLIAGAHLDDDRDGIYCESQRYSDD